MEKTWPMNMRHNRFLIAALAAVIFILYLTSRWSSRTDDTFGDSEKLQTGHKVFSGKLVNNDDARDSKLVNNDDARDSKSINNDDVHDRINFIERKVFGGWDLLYDEDALREEVENIHKIHYIPREGDKCVKRPPDVMIAGFPKTGTVELKDFMTIHPNIVTKNKEYLFKTTLVYRPSTIDDLPCAYEDQISFAKAGGGLIDLKRPFQLKELNPNMKLIFIVREPISRAKAYMTFRPTNPNARKLVVEDSKTLNRQFLTMLKSKRGDIWMSTYDKHFANHLKLFKRESILVLENIEFMHNPNAVFKKVEEFLGIRSFNSSEHFVVNPESQFYCIRKLDHKTQRMVCYERNRGRKPILEIDEDVKQKLDEYFKPHNENFFQMIGQRYDW